MTADLELHPQTMIAVLAGTRGVQGIQCTTVCRDGHRCRRWAIRGAYVCVKHGGQLPNVKLAASKRLQIMSVIALDVIDRLMRESEKDEVRLRAAKEVLRYAGINPRAMAREGTVRGRALKKLGGGVLVIDEEIEALVGRLRDAGELEGTADGNAEKQLPGGASPAEGEAPEV